MSIHSVKLSSMELINLQNPKLFEKYLIKAHNGIIKILINLNKINFVRNIETNRKRNKIEKKNYYINS